MVERRISFLRVSELRNRDGWVIPGVALDREGLRSWTSELPFMPVIPEWVKRLIKK
jgi:hypothetical protein